jgi:Arc/MetJ family transcription regulator
MRTTLDIDDDLLAYAKQTAGLARTSAGKVISDLARRGLEPSTQPVEFRNGFAQVRRKRGDPVITPEFIDSLLEETE